MDIRSVHPKSLRDRGSEGDFSSHNYGEGGGGGGGAARGSFHKEAFCFVLLNEASCWLSLPTRQRKVQGAWISSSVTEMLPLSHPEASRTSVLPSPSDIGENLPV